MSPPKFIRPESEGYTLHFYLNHTPMIALFQRYQYVPPSHMTNLSTRKTEIAPVKMHTDT